MVELKKMFKLVILFAVFMTLSCESQTAQSLFAERVTETCGERWQCVIGIDGITSFEWDNAYIFRPGVLDSEIESIIDKKVKFSEEFSYKYVFLKNNSVIFTEEHFFDFDYPEDGLVSFATTDDQHRYA